MIERLYKWISSLTLLYGPWVFKTYTWIVAAGFFLFYPPGVAGGIRFYRALFPEKSFLGRLWCVWKQYQNFTSIFRDRFQLEQSGKIEYTYKGWEHIESALKEKTGGVILMSHMGNWEMAAQILKRKKPDMPLLLYMGVKRKEQMEKIQKQGLAESGVKVIGIEKGSQSPFELIEAIHFLKEGGIASITGDRLWHEDQKTVSVPFLGHYVKIPKTPYLLALLSQAPIFVFFAFRDGQGQYRFSISEPIFVHAGSRAQRDEAVKNAARQYASMLEAAVRKHPLQWYHFGPFLGKRIV